MGSGKRKAKKLARQQNNAGGKRVPTVNAVSGDKKVPDNATTGGSYKKSFVGWTAREIDNAIGENHGCRWSLKEDETIGLLKFLEELTQKTWRECENEMSGGHKKNHDHAITDLNAIAQDRLRTLDENEERVFRFRLGGACRLWGFRSGDLFRILWYDPDHKVYPVNKRHT